MALWEVLIEGQGTFEFEAPSDYDLALEKAEELFDLDPERERYSIEMINRKNPQEEMAKKYIYEQIYDCLEKMNALNVREYKKLTAPGFMDLHIDRILPMRDYTGRDIPMIALSHMYEQAGDLIPDPDMQILIYPEQKMAEAFSYQDTYGYQQVYNEDMSKVNTKFKKELNHFLLFWLKNLHRQGFY